MALADVGDLGKGVDRAGRGGPRRRDRRGRPGARREVTFDRVLELL